LDALLVLKGTMYSRKIEKIGQGEDETEENSMLPLSIDFKMYSKNEHAIEEFQKMRLMDSELIGLH